MIHIKNTVGAIIYTAETASDVRGAVVEAASRGADLHGANLYGANLYGADLYGADLHGADLYGANLYGANLRGADLRGANLYGANLYGANLRGADLRGADLCGANLYGANLRGADLCGADLCGANLYGANLRGAENLDAVSVARTSIVPEEGSYIGWKKCDSGYVVKLEIPAKAKRSNASGRKCRAEYAKVLAIYSSDGGVREEARSLHDWNFVYRVGEKVVADSFDDDRWRECAPGIHHYITRAEAEAH